MSQEDTNPPELNTIQALNLIAYSLAGILEELRMQTEIQAAELDERQQHFEHTVDQTVVQTQQSSSDGDGFL